MLDYLQRNPEGFFQLMLYRAPAVLLALTVHECAHGYVALRCGDPTAKLMGRVTLNPLKHLDPIGTLFLFFLGFGWAKPVPVNPNNFRRGRRDDLLVSLAGVTSNFILFVLATMLSILIGALIYPRDIISIPGGFQFFLQFDQWGYVLQLYPKLSGDLVPYLRLPWLLHVQRFMLHFCMINLGLCIFNLLPIPPLDGFHVFNDILLKGRLKLSGRAFRIAQGVLLVLMFATGIVRDLVSNIISFVQSNVLGLLLRLFGV